MNDMPTDIAPLAEVLNEVRLVADRYDLRMPDGSGRYDLTGSSEILMTHETAWGARDAMKAIGGELAKIEDLIAGSPTSTTDAGRTDVDHALRILFTLRQALSPHDATATLPIADRMRAKTAAIHDALLLRGNSPEARHWNSYESGRYRVVEDVCLLLEEASEQADPALATEIRDFVGFLRDKQVGRMTPNGPIAGTWSNDPIRFMTEVNILVRRFADRLSPPVQDHKPIAS